MSNFPNSIDNDVTLPPINDNLTELGAEAINALRDAIFNIESEIGLTASGNTDSISTRLDVAFNPDGTLKASAITSLGLVTLPITQDQIANNAEIPETKLALNYSTQNLYNSILDVSNNVKTALGWISASGVKLEPHLQGFIYNHDLNQIEVSKNSNEFLKNKLNLLRDNAQSYSLIKDINTELVTHQQLDGSPSVALSLVPTLNGGNYPSYYGHTASGIYLNTERFAVIPQTAQDLQQFAEFIDSSSIFLYGSRIQNLYSNGISKVSRSSSLDADGYGDFIVPETPVIAYLLESGDSTSPVDDIDNGDDIVEFKPVIVGGNLHAFDAKFALVKPGDVLTINYGSIETKFIIKEKKYIQNGFNKKYIVRILGKNLKYSTIAKARIDRNLVNDNKFGVLAVAESNNNFGATPSLIVGSPRGASATGVGFNPDQLSSSNYLLYLALYPTGNPDDGYVILPPVDVTGNEGVTPNKYTLSSIIEATNNVFRQPGYNYRFIAFNYKGEFGIKLADSYNNTSFSILNACVNNNGNFDKTATDIFFKNNVIGIFSTSFLTPPDPLGFKNLASPPYMNNYGSAEAALKPVKLFRPLKRNNYYVNGIEKEKLTLEVGQTLDDYGDGYWVGYLLSQNVIPGVGSGPNSTGRVENTYRIKLDLSTSKLTAGKTIVIQKLTAGNLIDSGRFIIKDVDFSCVCDGEIYTDITVYDAVHATAVSPHSGVLSPSEDNKVKLYFNSDSVSFSKENSSDFIDINTPFKRYFEVFINERGETFTHERCRINVSNGNIIINGNVTLNTNSGLNKLNILKVSPKLLGYQYGSVKKITLHINNYDADTGIYDGYLAAFDQINLTNEGTTVFGKKGQVTRFYDETNIDFIDIIFDNNEVIGSFSNQNIDFQLFNTLSLNDELMLIGNCQFDELVNKVNSISDERQFGNISEKELSTSAIAFIEAAEKYLHSNGVIRGFNLSKVTSPVTNPNKNQVYIDGGLALVNGKLLQMNNATIVIPTVKEINGSTLFNINWVLCVNDKSEYQCIPLLDQDPQLQTPGNSRLFNVYNLIDGTTYTVDASSFSDIVNFRKDLTMLYVISASSQVSSTLNIIQLLDSIEITLSVSDVRKYVNDIDSNLPLKLTSSNSQGNFKNPESVLNWIKYNNFFNGTAIIKGSTEETGIINSAINLNFNSTVTILGESNATLVMNGPVTLGSNLTLKDLTIIFNGGVSIVNGLENLTIENCNIEYNAPDGITHPIFPSTFSTTNDVFVISNSNKVLIKNNKFTINYNTPKSGGNVFNITNTFNFKFENNSVIVDFKVTPNTHFPGNLIKLDNINDDTVITDSSFEGNFNKFLDIVNSNNLKLSNLLLTSTYKPTTNSPADFGYSSSNLVNSGQGWIYSNVFDKLDSVFIDNVTFIYSVQNSSDRFSFINFEVTNNNSIVNNVKITNCKFIHKFAGGSFDDFRPAIAIINGNSTTQPNTSQPILSNVDISNNTCSHNQSIILTSKTATIFNTSPPHVESGFMLYPGLVAQNCNIKNNICGTIGYWVATDSKIISLSNNVNSFNDKMNALNIENNICHYITNLDADGYYFLVSKNSTSSDPYFQYINKSMYPSGFVNINNNKANWIHVGISHDENSSLRITNNSLTAYDVSYISKFGDNNLNNYGQSYKYAIFVSSNQHFENSDVSLIVNNILGINAKSNDCDCIIDGNSINTGYWINSIGDLITYKYKLGYIFSQSSANITNNLCKGVDETFEEGYGILAGGVNNVILQNKIYKEGNTLLAYVGFQNYESGFGWDGSDSIGRVTENFFDSPFTNDATENENVVLFIPTFRSWTVDKNKNQTATSIISMNSGQLVPFGVNGGFVQTSPYNANFAILPAPSKNLGYKSLTTRIYDNATSAIRSIGWQENLNKYLPNGVTILNVKMPVRSFGSQVTTSNSPTTGSFNSNINLFINRYNTDIINSANLDYFTIVPPITQPPPYTNGVADDAIFLDSIEDVTAQLTGAQINSSFNTLLLNINVPTDIGDFSTKFNNVITISVDIKYQRQNELNLYFGPIIVKYRW